MVYELQRASCKLLDDAAEIMDELFNRTWYIVRRNIAMDRISDVAIRLRTGRSFCNIDKNS